MEELERVYTYYKALDSNIIKEEEIESDKSKDSCSSSESDCSSYDDLSDRELQENIYVSRKQ